MPTHAVFHTSNIKILPVNNQAARGYAATNRSPVIFMSKWQHVLMGMGWILSIMTIAWFVWLGISYSTNTNAISSERKHIEKAYDKSDQQAKEADLCFIDRARATEAGFKAAFPFHE
ncbi:MAG: hypothetical protein PHQ05_02995 [Sterolibacterium sp.]|nr:hypothetical protein [Sterolibacterium sp.]